MNFLCGELNSMIDGKCRAYRKCRRNRNIHDLRSILNLDGADLVEAPLHDVLALQHELTALALEVLLLPDCDLVLAHLLHLLSVHGYCFSLGGYSLMNDKTFILNQTLCKTLRCVK